MTPVDQMLRPFFLNSHITDSELEYRIDEYYNERRTPLRPNNSPTQDLSDEQLMLQYNGYF